MTKAEIRAYEHRFDDFDSLTERGRQIQDELKNGSTP